MINKILFIFIFFPVVFPNSFRDYSVPIFVLIGLFSVAMSCRSFDIKAVVLYLLGALVSLFYIAIGVGNSNSDFIMWAIFVYIASPLLWVYIWIYIFQVWSEKDFINNFKFFTMASCATVYIFLYLFLNYGPESVKFFIEESNVEFSSSNIGVTMHVLGSLIFLIAGFFAAPELFGKKIRISILIFMSLTVFVSGRSALILAMLFGMSVKFIRLENNQRLKYIFFVALLLTLMNLILGITYLFSNDGFSINVDTIFSSFIEKIFEGGGEDRSSQFYSLIQGIFNSYFMGVGHGVSTYVVRNEISPWKYELLGISTIFHVGILGLIVYLLPFILLYFKFIKLVKLNKVSSLDVFVITGLISILIASNTNPYLVSFDFQWMLAMPLVYFYKKVLK